MQYTGYLSLFETEHFAEYCRIRALNSKQTRMTARKMTTHSTERRLYRAVTLSLCYLQRADEFRWRKQIQLRAQGPFSPLSIALTSLILQGHLGHCEGFDQL